MSNLAYKLFRPFRRLEWQIEKRISDDRHKKMCYRMLKLLSRSSKESKEIWFWSMTPLPMGYPYLYQYFEGLVLAFLPSFLVNPIMHITQCTHVEKKWRFKTYWFKPFCV